MKKCITRINVKTNKLHVVLFNMGKRNLTPDLWMHCSEYTQEPLFTTVIFPVQILILKNI